MFGLFSGQMKKFVPTHAAERRRPGHDGLFHLLEGRRGRGKSYTMAYWLIEAARSRTPVRANFAVNPVRLSYQLMRSGTFKTLQESHDWVTANVVYMGEWREFVTAYDCIVILDEAARIFDSRRRSAPDLAFEFLYQSRKVRNTLVFASQSFDWLDVRVRQLADILWMARKEVSKKNPQLPTRFWLYGLDPYASGLTDAVIRNRADYLMSLPFDMPTASVYNSWELIKLLDGDPGFATMREIEAWHEAHGRKIGRSQERPLDHLPLDRGEQEALEARIAAFRGHLDGSTDGGGARARGRGEAAAGVAVP